MCVTAKIAKNSLKTHIFGVRCRSRSSMLVPPESSPAVLVMVRSKSVSICNHSRARLVDSSRNRTFSRGYANLMRSYGGLLEPRSTRMSAVNTPNILSIPSTADFLGIYRVHQKSGTPFNYVDIMPAKLQCNRYLYCMNNFNICY